MCQVYSHNSADKAVVAGKLAIEVIAGLVIAYLLAVIVYLWWKCRKLEQRNRILELMIPNLHERKRKAKK